MEGFIIGVALSMDFPSQTMTFHVPIDTPIGRGVYHITRVRNATNKDMKPYKNLPSRTCVHCGKAEW